MTRLTQTSLWRSSSMRTSQTAVVRPLWRGVAVARSVPSRTGRMWLALISRPKATFSGSAAEVAPTLATLSARTTLAPPWR